MTNDLPGVSILAANYNNSRYVIDALNSLSGQTYANIELIIVDDGSTDDSPKKIQEWLKGCTKPFKFIIHEKNKGICAVCNELVRNATGKYLSFIATDDMYLPGKIASQVRTMEQQDASVALVYSDTYLMDEHNEKKAGSYMVSSCSVPAGSAPSGHITEYLEKNNFLHWITLLIRRDIFEQVGLFDESLAFEDYDMSLRISKKFSIVFSPEIHTLYRVHDQSFSGKTRNWEELLLPVYLKHADLKTFRHQAEVIIVNKYVQQHPDARQLALQYHLQAGKKVRYHHFIINNIPPLFMKIYRKVAGLFMRENSTSYV